MRSGPRAQPDHPRTRGIISACAERTVMSRTPRMRPRDHLRVCGADSRTFIRSPRLPGSSPRVRSGRFEGHWKRTGIGIISACAERTRCTRCRFRYCRDHLRVCGADDGWPLHMQVEPGSSPRVRSGLKSKRFSCKSAGIISACAERTAVASAAASWAWDHLRVCGADYQRGLHVERVEGSSPRVRSGQEHQ